MAPSRYSDFELRAILHGRGYSLDAKIGTGGMAEVFIVEQLFLKRHFALKLVHPEHTARPAFVERLRREARLLGRVVNPHIVEVVDLWFEDDGTPFLVLELLRGRSLAAEFDARGRLGETETIRWATETLRGLAAAHAAGMIHRDIKPENLFLHESPEYDRTLKILDFGLARVITKGPLPDSPGPASATPESLVGSPNYMSPEALRCEKLDERTDLYGVGLVTFEALAGRGPFDFGFESAPPLQAVVPEVSPALASVIDRALLEDPGARQQSATAFLSELSKLEGH